MKKKITLISVLVLCLSLLTGCFCQHETWNEADCVTPKTCAACGETEGTPLGHVWLAATCDNPKTCETCGATEGEAKGHSWVDATCDAPKNCTACGLTEGEALEHIWEEATTEAPKTCVLCALTEGERIVTDPRFTTTSTKDIQGLWRATVTMSGAEVGMEGIIEELELNLLMDLCNDGTVLFSAEITDEETFIRTVIDAYVEIMYAEFESSGMTREEADDAMISAYGMDVREYLEENLGTLNFNELLASMYEEMNLGGVYFMEDGKLYVGDNWKGSMEETSYTLDGDTLIIEDLNTELGKELVFIRSGK